MRSRQVFLMPPVGRGGTPEFRNGLISNLLQLPYYHYPPIGQSGNVVI